MIDADIITELDVIDPEFAAARAWVRCEECDDTGESIDMVWQHDGAWLCWSCDIRGRHEYEQQRAYLEKIRYR